MYTFFPKIKYTQETKLSKQMWLFFFFFSLGPFPPAHIIFWEVFFRPYLQINLQIMNHFFFFTWHLLSQCSTGDRIFNLVADWKWGVIFYAAASAVELLNVCLLGFGYEKGVKRRIRNFGLYLMEYKILDLTLDPSWPRPNSFRLRWWVLSLF